MHSDHGTGHVIVVCSLHCCTSLCCLQNLSCLLGICRKMQDHHAFTRSTPQILDSWESYGCKSLPQGIYWCICHFLQYVTAWTQIMLNRLLFIECHYSFQLPRVPNDEFLNILIDRTRDFPRIAYAFLGPIPTVGLIHPETAKEILKTSGKAHIFMLNIYRWGTVFRPMTQNVTWEDLLTVFFLV